MLVDLKKWKQRNAAERVKAALTRPKKDNTGERLRRQFSTSADKAIKALSGKEHNPWLKYGYNDEVVVTAKLRGEIIPVTGDEAIALPVTQAKAYLMDVIDATHAGQLDRELLRAAGTPSAHKHRGPNLTTVHILDSTPASADFAPVEIGLRDER